MRGEGVQADGQKLPWEKPPPLGPWMAPQAGVVAWEPGELSKG